MPISGRKADATSGSREECVKPIYWMLHKEVHEETIEDTMSTLHCYNAEYLSSEESLVITQHHILYYLSQTQNYISQNQSSETIKSLTSRLSISFCKGNINDTQTYA